MEVGFAARYPTIAPALLIVLVLVALTSRARVFFGKPCTLTLEPSIHKGTHRLRLSHSDKLVADGAYKSTLDD